MTNFEKMIYGDSSDVISTLINSLVNAYHYEFKNLQSKISIDNSKS